MKKKFRNIFLIALLAIIGVTATMYSCSKESMLPNDQKESELVDVKSMIPDLPKICGKVIEKKLYNGSGRSVGIAYIYNDKENLHVLLSALPGHYFREAYLHSAQREFNFPMNADGNPDFTQFDYTGTTSVFSNIRNIVVPIESIENNRFFSVVVQVRDSRNDIVKQRAWIEGHSFGETGEGKYFVHIINRCKADPVDFPAEVFDRPDPVSIPMDKD